MKKTLGGERINSGKKMQVDLHGYGRSTHNLSYLFRTTGSFGTVIPFMVEVGLTGDTWDLELDCEVLTEPTLGPLFGSAAVELNVFQADARLYNSYLHNNMLGIGNHMENVMLPQCRMQVPFIDNSGEDNLDLDNACTNPSSLVRYLGIAGTGLADSNGVGEREFDVTPMIMYWDIMKNYYCNKQEELAWYINNRVSEAIEEVTTVEYLGETIQELPLTNLPRVRIEMDGIFRMTVTDQQPLEDVYIRIYDNGLFGSYEDMPLSSIGVLVSTVGGVMEIAVNNPNAVGWIDGWRYRSDADIVTVPIELDSFPLSNIDDMRNELLQTPGNTAYIIDENTFKPYGVNFNKSGSGATQVRSVMYSQQGLGVKTYKSDVFNNWLNSESIDGPGGITELSRIDTSGDSFTIDQFVLAEKVYKLLNRVLVAGGTYYDWNEVVYDHQQYTKSEIPVYVGGLIKELVFQEVVSNNTVIEAQAQPLGTLAGRGRLSSKHKGGKIVFKLNEVGYIMGLISVTPRVDYSQGNRWFVNLKNMNDFFKPQLSGIGFQNLSTETMAWWDTWNFAGEWTQKSAGKQPAWIWYMTNINRVLGNFAIRTNSMYMVLTRRYRSELAGGGYPVYTIGDLTTYIDPRDYNHIFAQTSLDSQNLWISISVDATVRRKMSAEIMPNI
ncbi:MAG: major capsid protein [Malazfec virus 2]